MPFRPDRIAFVSSGDPEEDERIARRIVRQEANEAEGLCPNGCAPTEWIDAHNKRCPVCGFTGWTNVPYGGEAPPSN